MLFQRPSRVASGRGHEPQTPLMLSKTSKQKPHFPRDWPLPHLQTPIVLSLPASEKGRPRVPSRPPHHKGASGGEWEPGGRRESRDSEEHKGALRQKHPQWGDLVLQPHPVPSPHCPGLPREASCFTLLHGPCPPGKAAPFLPPEELGSSKDPLRSPTGGVCHLYLSQDQVAERSLDCNEDFRYHICSLAPPRTAPTLPPWDLAPPCP